MYDYNKQSYLLSRVNDISLSTLQLYANTKIVTKNFLKALTLQLLLLALGSNWKPFLCRHLAFLSKGNGLKREASGKLHCINKFNGALNLFTVIKISTCSNFTELQYLFTFV